MVLFQAIIFLALAKILIYIDRKSRVKEEEIKGNVALVIEHGHKMAL